MKMCWINVERDSVCMGDDVDAPHSYEFEIEQNASTRALFEHLSDKQYLASVVGGAHTWDAVVEDKIVANFLANNRYPEPSNTLSMPISELTNGGKIFLYFKYNSAKY